MKTKYKRIFKENDEELQKYSHATLKEFYKKLITLLDNNKSILISDLNFFPTKGRNKTIGIYDMKGNGYINSAETLSVNTSAGNISINFNPAFIQDTQVQRIKDQELFIDINYQNDSSIQFVLHTDDLW
jgi:hypothetical protein